MRQAPAQTWALLHGISHRPVQWKLTSQRNWKAREGKWLIQRQTEVQVGTRTQSTDSETRCAISTRPEHMIEGINTGCCSKNCVPSQLRPVGEKKIKNVDATVEILQTTPL